MKSTNEIFYDLLDSYTNHKVIAIQYKHDLVDSMIVENMESNELRDFIHYLYGQHDYRVTEIKEVGDYIVLQILFDNAVEKNYEG